MDYLGSSAHQPSCSQSCVYLTEHTYSKIASLDQCVCVSRNVKPDQRQYGELETDAVDGLDQLHKVSLSLSLSLSVMLSCKRKKYLCMFHVFFMHI